MKLGPLRWALATGLSMGLAAVAAVLAPGMEDLGSRAFDRALVGAGFALAIVLLRPWWLIERGARDFARTLWASGLPRHAGTATLFLRGPLRLAWSLRDAMFRAHGWLAGFALGVALCEAAQSSLARWLFGSRFEGAAVLLGPLLGVLAGTFVVLALDRLPRLAAAWRLEGQVDARAAARILEHGAGALLLLLVACIMATANPSPATPTPTTLLGSISDDVGMVLSRVLKPMLNWTATHALLVLPLITLAALVGYALPWLLWREKSEYRRGLWLVVLDPEGDGARRGALTLRLVDALARHWRDGPITVVLDAALDVGGEQLHAALTLGRERAMFPRIAVELADWGQLLPQRQHWLASPRRELHLPAALMLPALDRFAGEGDRIVLVSGTVEPLAAWRDRFRHADCLVAWHGDAAAAAGSTVAGFRAVALDALASSGLLPSLPDTLSKVPTQASAVQAIVTEPEAAKAEPAGTAAANEPAQAATKEQALGPEPAPAPSALPEPILTAPAAPTVAQGEAAAPPPATATTSPPSVFVSYLVEYRPMVRQLEQALSALGVRVLYDQLVQPGQDWDLTLRRMLESADAVVAVVGQRSAGRRLQLAEIERTQQLAKPLIPVFVDRFDEPGALKTIMAANTDSDGQLKYLADCRGEEELADLLRVTAQRIAATLDQGRATGAGSARDATTGVGGPPGATITRTLSVIATARETLLFVNLDERQRSEWTLAYQPALVDRLLTELGDRPAWDADLARTLASLVLPPPLRAWVEPGRSLRLRLRVDQDTARFPWELLFSLAGHDIAPASIVRELAGLSVPAAVARTKRRTALLIANPSTAGAEVAFGLKGGLVDLPGAQHEAQGVERALSSAGFTVTRSIGEPAIAVMQALFRDEYQCVLVAAHALHEHEHDAKRSTGVPLSDGVLLTASDFAQMACIPDLVVLGAERLARIEHRGEREAALRRSMVAPLLGAGVRCVIAPGSLLNDDAAAHFSIAFFEAMAAGARAEDAMLEARLKNLSGHPKLGTWAAFQLYGDPDYRFAAAS